MEEEEHSDRMQKLAMVSQKLIKIKKYLNEDDTDNINHQITSLKSPESCLSYLTDLEKKRDPHLDSTHLTRLISFYTKVFSSMPLQVHCQNESYARMLVRFAQLKAIQDVNEADANFNVARSNSQNFAFVHIAHAEFAHSQGKTKRCVYILHNAIELGAKPKEMLEAALQRLQVEKMQRVPSEDKENDPLSFNCTTHESVKKGSDFQKGSRMSDGTGDLYLPSIFNSGSEPLPDDLLLNWRSTSHRNRAAGLPGRVPIVPFSISEKDDDDDDDDGNDFNGRPSNKHDASVIKNLSRQPSDSSIGTKSDRSSSRKSAMDEDFVSFRPSSVTPEHHTWDDQSSTSTLLHTHDTKDTLKLDDVTYNFEQVISSNSPESCWSYLVNLEKRGNPHTDINLLNKLKDCYSKVFSRLPIRKYSKNSTYARILVRYAELKGIHDAEEAEDHFIVARSNCKAFAFVHIAHAQFELSQGNVTKATTILLKAQSLNAIPAELLDVALRNLKTGEKQLVPTKREQTLTDFEMDVSTCGGNQDPQHPAGVAVNPIVDQPKPASKAGVSEWKIPTLMKHVSPEDKHITPPAPKLNPCVLNSLPTPALTLSSKLNPQIVCQTPNDRNPCANSFITPIEKKYPGVSNSSAVAPHRVGLVHPCTPLNQVSGFQTPQASFTTPSNESITIKGKQFFILKMIGRGGSSKVYQVLDQRKQLFAVKYVDLEEADAQTVESYKNEIQHLNHLQQYSDQIIKLYDYEVTNRYIYMLMECGNLDLNTWLRNRKTVNPLERKFYWKNMLEAVHTIHKHGIVHSDLKPANFVIVNASLKLIDFGIANRIQPDVTSIMKDSQVGTLNYMPPEAIKDTSSQHGKARSKISPKGDVWSLGCILYCMTYGKTPFQSITNQITKLHAIIDPSHKIEFPDISEKDLLGVLKRCLVRNPRERVSIAELLEHPYLQLKPQLSPEPGRQCNNDLKKILTDLAALQSPNSIIRAANNLAKMCSSGKKLDVAECAKST
ncbi:dual specificity protein kinase Ttk [Dunckerocampus dactyliophorus]|uniref:dual specificity protein kinase Ttk n=1 Tax=Dunckerocampus dactyliophorus TaxID=161453 RepID=UPI00240745B7|nr:dual specificity protein kinase Ttk [Dunckerocampus dactyliophorus]